MKKKRRNKKRKRKVKRKMISTYTTPATEMSITSPNTINILLICLAGQDSMRINIALLALPYSSKVRACLAPFV